MNQTPFIRPSWDEYFMEIVYLIAKRSTCLRRRVGAVIVKNHQILASGYNGVPSGIAHCDISGCIRERLKAPSGQRHELCRGLHAEQNAIIQAAYHGMSIRDSILYCTTKPCIVCTKMVINAGITQIIYAEDYEDDLASEMIRDAGLKVVKFFTSSKENQK